MTGPTGERVKITTAHRARLAFVYVRQSSLGQVRRNRESQRRQYDFAEQATALGWSRDRVVIIDDDQGKSGAIPHARTGFGRLVSAVARGETGIVLSLELSRLARNDADWHHLVYLCRWTATLIADEHGLYDPAASADRPVRRLLRRRRLMFTTRRNAPDASGSRRSMVLLRPDPGPPARNTARTTSRLRIMVSSDISAVNLVPNRERIRRWTDRRAGWLDVRRLGHL